MTLKGMMMTCSNLLAAIVESDLVLVWGKMQFPCIRCIGPLKETLNPKPEHWLKGRGKKHIRIESSCL